MVFALICNRYIYGVSSGLRPTSMARWVELGLRNNVATGIVASHSRDCVIVRYHLPVRDGNVHSWMKLRCCLSWDA